MIIMIMIMSLVFVCMFNKNLFFSVRAIDGDRGVNNRISYSIISGGEEHFDIDSSSGIVYTINQLDREDPNNSNGAYILEILVRTNLT